MMESEVETFLQTTILKGQPGNTSRDYVTAIGRLSGTGQFHLQAILFNSLGQTLAQSTYSFSQ
jgi:hypothetical protein